MQNDKIMGFKIFFSLLRIHLEQSPMSLKSTAIDFFPSEQLQEYIYRAVFLIYIARVQF